MSVPASSHIRTRLVSRAIVRVAGADAGQFLQGLVSNEVMPAKFLERHRGPAAYCGMFSARGRYLFDAFVVMSPVDSTYLLDIHADSLDDVVHHLRRYKLRSRVVVRPIPCCRALVSAGSGV